MGLFSVPLFCTWVQFVNWNLLPSSLESLAQGISLLPLEKCSAQHHLNTFWWVESDRRFLALHGGGVLLCIMQMREYVSVDGKRADIQACAKVTFTPNSWSRGLIGRRIFPCFLWFSNWAKYVREELIPCCTNDKGTLIILSSNLSIIEWNLTWWKRQLVKWWHTKSHSTHSISLCGQI